MGNWFLITGHGNKTADYASRAERRLAAMEAVLWNEEDGIWYDYDLEEQEPRNRFFISNMAPLLIYSANEEKVNKAIKYLKVGRETTLLGLSNLAGLYEFRLY